jgi:hypothetical protein
MSKRNTVTLSENLALADRHGLAPLHGAVRDREKAAATRTAVCVSWRSASICSCAKSASCEPKLGATDLSPAAELVRLDVRKELSRENRRDGARDLQGTMVLVGRAKASVSRTLDGRRALHFPRVLAGPSLLLGPNVPSRPHGRLKHSRHKNRSSGRPAPPRSRFRRPPLQTRRTRRTHRRSDDRRR